MRALWFGLLSLGISLGAAACQPNPTVFRGEPRFAGGPNACVSRCEADGLQMTGFVYSGEFATSCVCSPPTTTTAPAAPATEPLPSAPAAQPSPFSSADPSDADPLARRGPADSAGVACVSGTQAAVAGANAAQVAADSAAAAAEAYLQQQQMLQHRKP